LTEGSLREAGKNAKAPDVDTALTPEMLVRKYASVVLGLCMAHTKNFHDSEDIMQQVLLKAITRLNTLRDPARVRPWLIRIARRMCIDFHNKRTPLREIPDDLPAPSNPDDEHIESLHRAICRLPEGCREVVALYYLDGRKCASVARTLGISQDAVRSRLVRARLRLHQILTEKDYERQ